MGDRSLELKVGIFLLVSVGLLVGFALVLGNFRFSPGHILYVDFANSGLLRNGAKVKIAGINAGKVKKLEFLPGEETDAEGNPVFVRVELELDPEMAKTVTRGSKFFITTEGLLGEKYVEISPGPRTGEGIESGAVVKGEPPVELQVLAARAAAFVQKLERLAEGTGGGGFDSLTRQIDELLSRSANIARLLDEKLPSLIGDGSATLAKTRESLAKANSLMARGEELLATGGPAETTLQQVSEIATELNERLPGLLASSDALLTDTRTLIASSQELLRNVDGEIALTAREARSLVQKTAGVVGRVDPVEVQTLLVQAVDKLSSTLEKTSRSVTAMAGNAEKIVGDLADLMAQVKAGKGSLGAILTDREIYDDIRELVLELKRNPWKVLWKE